VTRRRSGNGTAGLIRRSADYVFSTARTLAG
jgi:hypothetical protein